MNVCLYAAAGWRRAFHTLDSPRDYLAAMANASAASVKLRVESLDGVSSVEIVKADRVELSYERGFCSSFRFDNLTTLAYCEYFIYLGCFKYFACFEYFEYFKYFEYL